ncbi:hypothetical protein AB4Y32_29730 [Paraburkholderia phymatum]|uniref:Uncharacterized protein n=1 Tax=Paraburkholderia phymatum TaxID=148447 RepID=A0ACC6U8C2_9BURK
MIAVARRRPESPVVMGTQFTQRPPDQIRDNKPLFPLFPADSDASMNPAGLPRGRFELIS